MHTPRTVTLELCDRAGRAVGALPPFEVATPWFQEVESVVTAARDLYGAELVVLRLLSHGASAPVGGDVSYLAELIGEDPRALRACDPTSGVVDDLRLSYARPGGWVPDLEWADAKLRDIGRPRTGPAQQMRTWNLSCIWKLPTGSGPVWLKVVPPFFAHEGSLMELLPVGIAPTVLATEGPRVLLDDVGGSDLWEAGTGALCDALGELVALQVRWTDRRSDLLSLGAPDWRAASFTLRAVDVVDRHAHELDARDRATLTRLLDGLATRFASLDSCGLPDTLVHGDFHPGNIFRRDSGFAILDWGDAGLGQPVLDLPAATQRLSATDAAIVETRWVEAWRALLPDSDPARAIQLAAPIGALRQAIVYRGFLDHIERSEHVYHHSDPAHWLRRAATLAVAEPPRPSRRRREPE